MVEPLYPQQLWQWSTPVLSRLDYFAAAALTGLVARGWAARDHDGIAKEALKLGAALYWAIHRYNATNSIAAPNPNTTGGPP